MTNWSCLLDAFAIILNEESETLIDEIGHDGSEIVWPTLFSPYCRRSFHIQEMIDCCLSRGKMVTTIERNPISRTQASDQLYTLPIKPDRFDNYLKLGDGVLISSERLHAVAWIDGRMVDRNKQYDVFPTNLFFLIR